MTTDEQLHEALATTAMTRHQEYALRDQLRRCVRCKHYDSSFMECGNRDSQLYSASIPEPLREGCVHFDD